MPEQKRVDPSKLGELYPTPKTYDERRAERAEIDALKESRKPRFITLRASALLTLCMAIIIATINVIPIVFNFNLMAGTFASMGILIGIVWYIKWLIGRIVAVYEINGKNPQPLLLMYPIILGAFTWSLYAILGWRFLYEPHLILLALCTHVIITFATAQLTKYIR